MTVVNKQKQAEYNVEKTPNTINFKYAQHIVSSYIIIALCWVIFNNFDDESPMYSQITNYMKVYKCMYSEQT